MAILTGTTTSGGSFVPKKKKKKETPLAGTQGRGGVAPYSPPAQQTSEPKIPVLKNEQPKNMLMPQHLFGLGDKFTPTYQSVSAQRDAITSAFHAIHGTDPPLMAMTLFLTTTSPDTTEEQYRMLMDPARKTTAWQTPGSAEINAMREQTSPSALMGWGNGPAEDLRDGTVFTYSGGTQLNPSAPTGTPYGANSALARARQEFSHYPETTGSAWYDLRARSAQLETIGGFKGFLADRTTWYQKYIGVDIGLPFDRNSSEYDDGTDKSSRQLTLNRLLGQMIYGSEKQFQEAADIFKGDGTEQKPGLIWQLSGMTADSRKLLAATQYARSNFLKGFGLSPAMKKVIYAGWVAGRPDGQSIDRSRIDFASQWGTQNLPLDEQAAFKTQQSSFTEFLFKGMNLPISVGAMVTKPLHDWMPEGHFGESDYTLADFTKLGIPKIKGLDQQKSFLNPLAYVGDIMDAVNGIAEAVAAAPGIPGAAVMEIERESSAVLDVFGVAAGTHIVDKEGRVVTNPAFLTHQQALNAYEGEKPQHGVPVEHQNAASDNPFLAPESPINWDVVHSGQAWAAARKTAEGKMIFNTMVDDMALTLGHERSQETGAFWQALGFGTDAADVIGAIWIGKGIEKAGAPVIKAAGVKGFNAARGASDYIGTLKERYNAEPATGEWVFKKGDSLPPEAAAHIDELIAKKVPFDTEGSTLQDRHEATIVKRTPTGVRWSDGHFTPYEKLQPLYDWGKKQETSPLPEGTKIVSEHGEYKVIHRPNWASNMFDVLHPDGTIEEGYGGLHNAERRAEKLASDSAKAGVEKPTPAEMPGQTSLTAAADALLKSVDDGGVPGSITSNMKRVASENGIEVTKDMTPNDVVDALRAKEMPGQTEMPAEAAAVIPIKRTGKLPPKLTPDEFEQMRPPVQGLSYHGSPEGQLTKLDPWSSQSVPPGTYTTTSPVHADVYARGETARLTPDAIRAIAKERGISGIDLITGEWRYKVYDKSFGQGRINYIEGVPRKTINLDEPLEPRVLNDIKEAAKRSFPKHEYSKYDWTDFDWEGMKGKTGQQVYNALIDAIGDAEIPRYEGIMDLQGLNEQLGKFGYDAFVRTEGKPSSGFGQKVTIWMEHAIESDRAQVVSWEDAYQRYSSAYDRALAKHPEMAPAERVRADVTTTPPSAVGSAPVSETPQTFSQGETVEFVKDTKTEAKGVGKVVSYDAPSDTVVVETPNGKTVNTNGALTTKTTEAGVKVAPVETGNRAEEAESFYTDVAGDMRGSGDVIDEPLKNFHPADVTEKMPTIMGETETQTRIAYAMDEAMRRTLTAHDIEVVPGAERGLIEDAFAQLPAKARTEELFANLADVLDERKLWDGVTTAEVDASIAPEIQRLNDNGYPTTQSHSAATADHPVGSPALESKPYVEFAYKDLVGEDGSSRVKKGNIVRAVKEIGGDPKKDIVPQPGGKTFIVHGDVAKLTDALLGAQGRAEGAPPFVPPAEAATPVEPLPPYRQRYNPLLRTKAEVIAGITDPNLDWFIHRVLLNQPDDPISIKTIAPVIKEMILSNNPDEIGMRIREVTSDEVDPTMPGLLYHARVIAEQSALRTNAPAIFRIMTTYTAFDNDVKNRGTDRDIFNFALFTKMGKKVMDQAEWQWVNETVSKIWKTDDMNERARLVDSVDKRLEQNMRDTPVRDRWSEVRKKPPRWTNEWDKHQFFRHKVHALQADSLLATSRIPKYREAFLERTAYGEKKGNAIDRNRSLIAVLSEEYRKAANPDQMALIESALNNAKDELAQMKTDARIIRDANDGTRSWEDKVVQEAEGRWERRSGSQPVYGFQLRKNLSHNRNIDPRMLAIYQAGPAARAFELSQSSKWNLVYGNNIMRMWKSIVMSSLGFPVRVNAGDEAWRLIPEGLVPGSPAFFEARRQMGELFGKRTFREWAGNVRGRGVKPGEGTGLLSSVERGELKTLRSAKKRSPEQQTRLDALEQQTKGSAYAALSGKLFDMAFSDYVEASTKDWAIRGPNDGEPNYVPAFQDFFQQLAQEPHMQRWREGGMQAFWRRGEDGKLLADASGEPVFDRAAAEDFVYDALTQTDEGVKLLTQTGRGRVKDGHLYADKAELGDLITAYTDHMEAIQHSPDLTAAMKTGRITSAQMSRAGDDLWSVPVSIGHFKPWRSSVFTPSGFYEAITLPMMESFNYQLRGTFFGGEYLKQMRRLSDEHPEWKPEELQDAASQRALDYVNDVTFSRRSTVGEDLFRNVLPFVSSYRQFAVYWLKTFAKHPFALGGAAAAAQTLGVGGWYGPFWMQQDKYSPPQYKKSIVGQSYMSFNPWIGWLVGRATNYKTDIGYFPMMSGAQANNQPLNVLGGAAYALMGWQLPFSRPIGPYEWKLAQFQNFNSVYTPAPKEGGVATMEPDGGLVYNTLKHLGVHDPLALEALVRNRLSPGGGTQTVIPQVQWKQQLDAQYGALTSDSAQATFRAAHPKYDALLLMGENPTRAERLRLISKYPDLPRFENSLYSYAPDTPHNIPFLEMISQGYVDIKNEKTRDAQLATTLAQIFGGNLKAGDGFKFFPGDLNVPHYTKQMNGALKDAHLLITKAAKDWAAGRKDVDWKAKRDFWLGKCSEYRSDRSFAIPAALEDWARKQGIKNPQILNIGAIKDKYDWLTSAHYAPQEPSAQNLAFPNLLESVGAMSPETLGVLEKGSPNVDGLMQAGLDNQVANRKALLDTKIEESFKLDSIDLQKMGYKAGAAFDRAQSDVETFFYKKGEYGWYKAKGESTTSEGRAARNRYYAYRDKRMQGVAGGEAVRGGLTQTLKLDKYFSDPMTHGSFGFGTKASEEQKLWKTYVAESLKAKPDMKKILDLKTHFDGKLKDRYEQRQRVNDWIATNAIASIFRGQMKSSYSDFYKGPGNSVFTNMGQAKVKQLERTITKFYTDDRGETRDGSVFAADIKTYFGDAHGLAYKLLEWYYH